MGKEFFDEHGINQRPVGICPGGIGKSRKGSGGAANGNPLGNTLDALGKVIVELDVFVGDLFPLPAVAHPEVVAVGLVPAVEIPGGNQILAVPLNQMGDIPGADLLPELIIRGNGGIQALSLIAGVCGYHSFVLCNGTGQEVHANEQGEAPGYQIIDPGVGFGEIIFQRAVLAFQYDIFQHGIHPHRVRHFVFRHFVENLLAPFVFNGIRGMEMNIVPEIFLLLHHSIMNPDRIHIGIPPLFSFGYMYHNNFLHQNQAKSPSIHI